MLRELRRRRTSSGGMFKTALDQKRIRLNKKSPGHCRGFKSVERISTSQQPARRNGS
jgi:hypothetical protein